MIGGLGTASDFSHHALRQEIEQLKVQTEKVKRAIYGEPENRIPSLADQLDQIRVSVERVERRQLYWRVAGSAGFFVLFLMLMGLLLK